MMKLIFSLSFLTLFITLIDLYILLIFLMFIMFYMLISFNMFDWFSMISYMFGGDILSFSLIILSFWIIFLMVLASSLVYKNMTYYSEFMFMNVLLLIFLMFSFSVNNLFMYYFFFECSLIPTLILIFGWGYQPERLMAGYYLLFYTLFFSLPMLLGIFYINNFCFSMFYFLIYVDYNFYLYVSMLLAFLAKMPMIFIHFWLRKAHVEAPISGSMILAGVLLKLGGYGIMRFFLFYEELLF